MRQRAFTFFGLAFLAALASYSLRVVEAQSTTSPGLYVVPTNQTTTASSVIILPRPVQPSQNQRVPSGGQTVIVTNTSPMQTNAAPAPNVTIVIVQTNILQPTGIVVSPQRQEPLPTDRDRLITQQITQSAQANFATLSMPSVQIATVNGKVTLQGTVDSQQTKDELVAIASRVAGANNVNDQLMISRDVNHE